ncbi:flagellar export chaperone FlgN [Nocardioides acrostichi]|uniref:Flagellar export chaperone FlgN n=1 Tax=Nocardioides acrostichi TaxID=2784339 RepID=A0A930V1D9_9ACTN|nr:flagellar export chaperone FlgN [Nocardioides acrostichi]MBF4163617.1 flagellar export chaperone FlgN [Nocardioides acrostichi]
MEKLSLMLWRERELLEALLYRLEVEQLMLAANRTVNLARAARDVDAVLDLLRETEVLRGVAATEVAAELGCDPGASLAELAEIAEEPWRTILVDHRDAFHELTRRVGAVSATNRDLLSSGAQHALDAFADLGDLVSFGSPLVEGQG